MAADDSSLEASILEIYQALFSGETLKMEFPSRKQVETFRVRLHKTKKKQETIFLALGMLEQDDKKSLSFKIAPGGQIVDSSGGGEESVVVTLQLITLRRPGRTYSFVVEPSTDTPDTTSEDLVE